MGIYIQDMKIPTAGRILIVLPSGRTLEVSADSAQNILGEAQAIPIPPHGRLGDLDELKAEIEKEDSGYELSAFGDGMWTAFRSVYQCIDAAPIIIPAEEDE